MERVSVDPDAVEDGALVVLALVAFTGAGVVVGAGLMALVLILGKRRSALTFLR